MSQESSDASSVDGLTRRRMVAGLGGGGLAALLAGCSGTTENANGGNGNGNGNGGGNGNGNGGGTTAVETVTTIDSASLSLSGWQASNEEQALLRELVGEFETEYGNISVDYNVIQSEYKQKMKTQLGSGNAPDVFYVDAKYHPSWASSDVLLDLSPYINGDDGFSTDAFFDPLIEAFQVDGQQYGIPKGFSPLGLFHNTAHFEEAGVGVPETWSEFRAGLQAIKDAGIVDAPMIEYPNCRMFKGMIYQNGGSVLNDSEDECVVASEANIETLEYIVGLKQDDLLMTPSELGEGWHGTALGNETVSAAILGAWGLPFLENNHAEVDENIDIAPHLPIPEGGEKATAAFTVCYGASANTNSPGAAYRLISELTGQEGAQQWAEKGLELTAREDLADIEYYENHPRRKTMLDAGAWSEVVQYGTNSAAVENRLNPELEAAMLEEKTPQAALETAQQKINDEVL